MAARTERSVGFQLARAGHHVTRAFEATLAPHGLRPMHMRLLSELADHGPAHLRELTRRIGTNRQTMVNTADDLVAAGLVREREQPGDRRLRHLELTAAGREKLEQAARAGRTLERRLFRALSADERAVLHALLERVADDLADAGAPTD